MTTFQSVFSCKNDANLTLLIVDAGSSSYIPHCLSQLCMNQDQPTARTHILSFVYDFSVFISPGSDVVLYDFQKQSTDSIAHLLKNYKERLNPSFRNIMIIDDFQLFLINYDKDFERLTSFFKELTKICQLFAVTNRDTCTSADLRFCLARADKVITLGKSAVETPMQVLCNIITTKSSGKIVHNQTTYDVINGQISEIDTKKISSTSQRRDPELKSLTTFKLTLEEDEKESKNRLHLPYFNAQSVNPSDLESQIFDDEDEDDEEI